MPLTINGTTAGGPNNFTTEKMVGNCGTSANVPGPDQVYAITPATAGMLKIVFVPTYSLSLLHVRTQCPGTADANEIACQWAQNANATTTVMVPVAASTPYYVIPDSFNGSSMGPFTLTITLM